MTDVECRPAKVGLDRSMRKAAFHRLASRSLERCPQNPDPICTRSSVNLHVRAAPVQVVHMVEQAGPSGIWPCGILLADRSL